MALEKEEKNDVKEEEKKYPISDSFSLDVVTKPFIDEANQAIERITEFGRPIIQIENYLNSKIKDDPILVKQLLRVYLSSYTNDPINAGVLAPTSEGKTYATVEVSNIFPKKDIISVGRISPTSLIHDFGTKVDEDGNPIQPKIDRLQQELFNAEAEGDKKTVYAIKQAISEIRNSSKNMVDLNGKILLFLDNPTPPTYEMLKPILSHDKKEILYKTTKSDGSLSVKETIIRGWPAVIVCSAKNEAKNEVWEEIATRFFIISPNTNISKYHEANRLTSQKSGIPSWASGAYENSEDRRFARFYIYRLKDSLENLCKDGENAVFNPFAQVLADKFPHNQGVTMRHFKRLMSFCNLETLINANTLMKIEFIPYKGKKKISIVTSLGVIKDAIKIIGKRISTVPPEKIKFYEEIFVPALNDKTTVQTSIDENYDQKQQKLIENYQEFALTSAECAEKYAKTFHKPITRKQISENFLKPLVDEGLIETIDNPENKSQKLYVLSSQLTIHNLEGVDRHLIDTVDTDFLYIWLCLARLGQVSIKIGKITKIFDSKNDTITYHQFKEKILQDTINDDDNEITSSSYTKNNNDDHSLDNSRRKDVSNITSVDYDYTRNDFENIENESNNVEDNSDSIEDDSDKEVENESEYLENNLDNIENESSALKDSSEESFVDENDEKNSEGFFGKSIDTSAEKKGSK